MEDRQLDHGPGFGVTLLIAWMGVVMLQDGWPVRGGMALGAALVCLLNDIADWQTRRHREPDPLFHMERK